MLSSNLFYPSNYKERNVPAAASIQETINGNQLDIFDREKNPATSAWLGKTVRFVMRSSCGFAIGVLLAPVGTIYHLTMVGRYTFLCLPYLGDSSHNWQKIKEHAAAFFIDLTVTLLSTIGSMLGIGSILLALEAGISVSGASYLALCAVGNFIPFFSGISPRHLSIILAYSDERAGFIKSILLSNEFGIKGQNGKLLPFDATKDQETLLRNGQIKGHFANLWRERATRFRVWMDKINGRLGQFQIQITPPPNLRQFLKYIQDNKEAIVANSNQTLTAAKLEIWTKRMENYEEHYRDLNYFLQDILELKANSFFSDRHVTITMPEFPQ